MSINVETITKNYGSQKALDGLSFSVNKGEVTGFLGPNGAGKSTMMKILTTYLKPTSGEATVNTYSTEKQPLAVRKSVGYLAENNPLYPEMYIREYLKLQAELNKVSTSRIDEVIALTGLQPEISKKIKKFPKEVPKSVSRNPKVSQNVIPKWYPFGEPRITKTSGNKAFLHFLGPSGGSILGSKRFFRIKKSFNQNGLTSEENLSGLLRIKKVIELNSDPRNQFSPTSKTKTLFPNALYSRNA